MAVSAERLWPLLRRVGNDNAAGEYYLPDIVMLARSDGHSVVIETNPDEVAGINSRAELADVELAWQRRRRALAMADGVSLVAPETVWFSHDTEIGRDTVVEPNVVFGPAVRIAEGARIRAFSHIEGASIATRAEIGPYARLRPGTEIGEKAKVGNFVEVKKAKLGAGAKASHLTYLGDATVGEGAFIGSNSALVAPVAIGAGAIVGAGSVVTRDVAPDALALARGEQREKPGWAARFRATMRERKKAKG
jgi:bifunctional UDP-N-acetylglucosamine pyrophosphorylase/glucosamine-1-phosphate N-acetyltransferase